MRTKKAAIATLVFLFSIAAAAGPVAIGTVSTSMGASIDGTNLAPGATVYSGDKIDVGTGGSVSIAVPGGGQVQILQNSIVQITKSADSIRLTIDHGDAQTTGKGFVVNRDPAADGSGSVSGNADEDKSKDKGCEVSKDSRRKKHCKDGTDR